MSAKVQEEFYFKGLLPSATYGISVWGSCNLSSIAEIENVHVRATKPIHKIPSSVPNHQVLEYAKWKSISYLYKRRLSCIAYQCYYGLSHEAIDSLMLKKGNTCLSSTTKFSLHIREFHYHKFQTTYQVKFSSEPLWSQEIYK